MAGSAVIGNLAVNLTLETAAFQNGATMMEKRTQQLGKKMQDIGAKMRGVGAIMSVGITAPFVALMSKAIPAAIESREALAQVEAGLKSMGGASGKTSVELQKSAAVLQRLSTFDDDDILRKVTANLLTFGNVSGEQFDKAQLAIVNMATRLNMDLQPATIMIGKALNDPIKGLTAMGRAGIQFTDAQKEMIKGMVETGNLAGAQGIILGELERQFGGAAAAARKASPGADIQEQWRTFTEKLGELALKVLPPLTSFMTRVLELLNGLSPSTQAWVVGTVALAAALGPVLIVVGSMVSGLGLLLPLVLKLGPAIALLGKALLFIAANPAILGLAVVIGGIYLAWKNWDKIEPIVRNLYNGVKNWLVDKLNMALNAVKEKINQVTNAFKNLYDKVVGHSYVPDLIEEIGAQFETLGRIMVDPALSATQKVGAAFHTLSGLIDTVFSKLFGKKAGAIAGALAGLAGSIIPLFGRGSPTQGFTGPAGANGLTGTLGGLGGMDRNLLSLNGSPIARVSRGEGLTVSPANQNNVAKVHIIPSPYFDVRVQGHARAVAVPLAGQAAVAGAAGAGLHAANAARRRIP